MKHLRYFSIICFLFLTGVTALADKNTGGNSVDKRQAWFQEMMKSKLEYIGKELQLTEEQKGKFAQVYGEMQKELGDVHSSMRKLEKEIEAKGDVATDADYEKCTNALFEVHQKEGVIDAKYLPLFKKILSKKQLFNLKRAEMKWQHKLMKHRHTKTDNHKIKRSDSKSKKR